MFIRRTLPAAATLAAAVLIWAPGRSEAYNVFGDTLDLAQRDYRIFNNFTDPSANDNLTPDPDYPGSFGAEIAIRKGVAEWGSAPHGSGRSDPTQPIVGSGASNFDAFYSGRSGSAGFKNQNVISELFGSSFVYASTDIPIRDGWRIRFYSAPHVWNDGPTGDLVGGDDAVDIQGVATHEYGHALGLDHSADPTATMYAALVEKGVPQRSLEADDIAGVQFLYGPIDPSKPRIDGYELVPGGVLLFGRNFHPKNNEIWFTHRLPVTGPDGDPVKVGGVAAAKGGESLHVAVPPEAGPGDILVRVPGQSFAVLSNAFPFDPEHELLPPPRIYGTAKVTSLGTTPVLTWTNLPSARVGSFGMKLVDAMPSQPAVLLSSPWRADTPFLGGTLLISGKDSRREVVFNTSFVGTAEIDVPVPVGEVGTTRYFQVWFADPGDPFSAGLTNAIEVTYQH